MVWQLSSALTIIAVKNVHYRLPACYVLEAISLHDGL